MSKTVCLDVAHFGIVDFFFQITLQVDTARMSMNPVRLIPMLHVLMDAVFVMKVTVIWQDRVLKVSFSESELISCEMEPRRLMY